MTFTRLMRTQKQGINGIDTYTKFMCHFNGNWQDSEAVPKSTIAYGTSFDMGKFGQAVTFNGTSEYMYSASHTDFTLGTGAWTFDFWLKIPAFPTATQGIVGMRGYYSSSYTASGSYFRIDTAGKIGISYMTSYSATATTVIASTPLPINQWVHVAIQRNKTTNTLEIFYNGIKVGSGAIATGTTFYVLPSAPLQIGCLWTSGSSTFKPSNYFCGSLDEFRFSKGIARYSGNFTPPTGQYI